MPPIAGRCAVPVVSPSAPNTTIAGALPPFHRNRSMYSGISLRTLPRAITPFSLILNCVLVTVPMRIPCGNTWLTSITCWRLLPRTNAFPIPLLPPRLRTIALRPSCTRAVIHVRTSVLVRSIDTERAPLGQLTPCTADCDAKIP